MNEIQEQKEKCTLPEKARSKECLPWKCKGCGWNRSILAARTKQIRQELPEHQEGIYRLTVTAQGETHGENL